MMTAQYGTLEPIHGNKVVASEELNTRSRSDTDGEDRKEILGSRMLNAAARRIVQLEKALEESQQRDAEMEKMSEFYESKIARLHKAQMYSVDRMGKRIDVLEGELMTRTSELEQTKHELRRAVEKVVALQQEVSTYRSFTNVSIQNCSSEEKKARRREPKKQPSVSSSAGSEGLFEGSKATSSPSTKRCKIEREWDDVIVPDSFMTSVDSPSVTSNKQRDGFSRFFPFGGHKNKQPEETKVMSTKPSEMAIRPNVIEDFYETSEKSFGSR